MNGQQRVTPEMTLELSAAFKNTHSEFWLRVQGKYDLALVRRRIYTDATRVFWGGKAALTA